MRHTHALIALLLCSLCLNAPSRAQGLLLSDPSFDGDERDCVIMTLELDEEQADQFDELLTVYATEIAAIFTEIQQMEEQDEFDDFTIQKGIELWEEFSDRVNERQKTLFDDLALFLTEEQAQRVPTCRVRLRRMGITNGGSDASLPGGVALGVDPITLAIGMDFLQQLDADRRAAFDRALSTYDQTMNRNIDSLVEDGLELAGRAEGFEDNPMAALFELQDEIKKVVKSAKTLREDHQDLGFAIGRTLPDEQARAWNDAFKRALYPGPYARIDSEVILERLLDQTVLTDEEFAAVLQISADLRRRTGPLREEWREELDQYFRKFELNLLTIASLQTDNVGEPFRQRMIEINEQTIATLRARVKNDVVEALMADYTGITAPERRDGGRVEVRIESGDAPREETESAVEIEVTTEDDG